MPAARAALRWRPRAALPGGGRELQSVVEGEGRLHEPAAGPMLIVSADSDHTVPWAIANASYKKQKRNVGVTEIVKMPRRGHALTIDGGWREAGIVAKWAAKTA
jgi:non-heme chloroperoxidase